MQTAATPMGKGWPGRSGRARCTPSSVYGEEKLDALSGSALGGALALLAVSSRPEYAHSFTVGIMRGVRARHIGCLTADHNVSQVAQTE